MAEDELGPDEGRDKKKISKTTWIYLGLAAGGLLMTYLIYEHSKQSSGSASSSNSTEPGTEMLAYQPGTEMEAYQQGIQDALALIQAQQGTGAEGSSNTTPSTSSGSGTSSASTPTSGGTTPTSGGTTPVYIYPPVNPYWGEPVYWGRPGGFYDGTPVKLPIYGYGTSELR